MTAEVCEPLCKLTAVKTDWAWNKTYQDLYEKAKTVVKRNVCLKFYNVARPLYFETDASGIVLGAKLLHVRGGMNCRCDRIPNNAIP